MVYLTQIHAIEDVKHVETQLQMDSVGNGCNLIERHIGLREAWISKLVYLLISFLSHGGK